MIFVIISSFILISCSSNPYEQYKDYYYEYKNDDKINRFTYVLYLGEEGDHLKEHNQLDSKIPERQRQSSEQKQRSRKPHKDDFISLSFRMEEEAFERLEKRLLKNDFCHNEPVYSSQKYTWLRYTIKGHCE